MSLSGRVLLIGSRLFSDPENPFHTSGTGITQGHILGVLEELGFDVYFGGQEDAAYPIKYITESRAIIYLAPALPKFINYKPRGKLILCAWSSHVLVRNQRMRDSARKWGLPVESLLPEDVFLEAYAVSDYITVSGNRSCIETFLDNGIPRQKIVPLNTGIDATLYRPGGEKFNDFTFMHWSSEVGLRKGLPVLLAAWKKWNNPQAKLVLMGMVTEAGRRLLYKRDWLGRTRPNWPANIEVPHLIRYGSLDSRRSGDIFFRTMIAKSHVGVLPTLEDAQPTVAREMAASGLPMIMTEQAGFELDQSWSYRVEMDDVDSLVEAFDQAYRDKNLSQRARKARQFMIDHHSWGEYRVGLSSFLTSVLS
jgi:glycosyltransferase involved in cell wall biosynthesis